MYNYLFKLFTIFAIMENYKYNGFRYIEQTQYKLNNDTRQELAKLKIYSNSFLSSARILEDWNDKGFSIDNLIKYDGV